MSGGVLVELVDTEEGTNATWLGVHMSEINVDRPKSEDIELLGDKKPLEVRYISSLKVCELVNAHLSALRAEIDALNNEAR